MKGLQMGATGTRLKRSAGMRAAAGLVLGLPLSWVVACSAASNSTSPTGSGPGGAGGTGGAGASGGTGATQGSGGGGSAGTGATCNQRTADPNDFPACSFCAGGRCVQTNAVPESARRPAAMVA